MRLPDRDLIGDEVVTSISRFRAQFAVFGVAGVAQDGGLVEFHPEEIRVRERMGENAEQSLVVADSTIFGRFAQALGSTLSAIDNVISDRLPPSLFVDLIETLGDRIGFCEQGHSA